MSNRREFLAVVGSIGGLNAMSREIPARRKYINKSKQTRAETLSGIPEDPEDRFIMVNHSDPALQQRRGWESAERDQVVDEILDLDPSVFDVLNLIGFRGPPKDTGVPPRSEVAKSFAHEYGYPWGVGVHYAIHEPFHEYWYSDLPDEEKWRHPDGEVVEHPRELAAADFNGDRRYYGSGPGRVVPSIFADGTLDRLAETGRQIFELGANHFWIDSTTNGLTFGLDFSRWAQTEFRAHLRSLPSERLDELGIDGPDEFSIVEYLQNNGLSPADTDAPATDPVFREYVLFQHESQKQFIRDTFEGAREDLPTEVAEAGTSVSGLGYGLQAQRIDPADIYQSDHVDIISVETDPTVPPDRPHDMSVKIGRAAGKFEKPVRVWGRTNEQFGTLYGFDPEGYYPTLLQFQTAQAYAHGGRRNISLTSLPSMSHEQSVNSWMRPDGTIADRLQRFVEFIRAHRPFLDDAQEANRTAVTVSLPTLLWQRQPDYESRITDHSTALSEATQVLRRQQIPYDVLILDHPPLWSAPQQTDGLPEYDSVIMPGVESVSDAHATAVTDALDADTTVITTGTAPERNAEYKPREDLKRAIEDSENGTLLNTEPDETGRGNSADKLKETLRDTKRQVRIDSEADVSVNVVRQADPARLVVHLVNFEYDETADEMTEITDFDLTVSELPFSPEAARYYSVDGVRDLTVDGSSEGFTVHVPKLDVWGFVAFGEAAAALEPDVSESEAKRTISDARNELQRVEDRTPAAATVARAKLGNADQVLEYDAYGVAKSQASDALSLLSNLSQETDDRDTQDQPQDTGNESTQNSDDEGVQSDSDQSGGQNSRGMETPGFGVLTGLAGLSGAGYLLNRLRDDDSVDDP